eukprot:m.210223 g.210223  ORF g.210223 m.210223 type:complete len:102 (+) comp33068_c1_seq2:222-527(+)
MLTEYVCVWMNMRLLYLHGEGGYNLHGASLLGFRGGRCCGRDGGGGGDDDCGCDWWWCGVMVYAWDMRGMVVVMVVVVGFHVDRYGEDFADRLYKYYYTSV